MIEIAKSLKLNKMYMKITATK
uniref:Uncharacterized protein n=1 Tax=Arundo donax TaxID=35708 RepID=A0A0A9A225_ARUDO